MPAVKGAEGKAEQRKRNVGPDGKPLTRSGSSGAATKVSAYPAVDWEDIEDEVQHLTDVAGRISHSQVGAGGQMVATVSVPLEYAHSLLDVHMKARDGLVYFRMYYVDLATYLGDDGSDDDEDDDDA